MEPKLIVFDIDTTLANTDHRYHYIESGDWDKFYSLKEVIKDEPNPSGILLYSLFDRPEFRVEIWTGRSAQATLGTKKWIKDNLPYPPAALLMRPRNDRQTNQDLKRLFIRKSGKPNLVFEWNTEACLMWEKRHIPYCYLG